MNRVLVAVDGSEAALRAVDLAADIAGHRDVEFVIATVAKDCGLRKDSLELFAYSEHLVGPVAELSAASPRRHSAPRGIVPCAQG